MAFRAPTIAPLGKAPVVSPLGISNILPTTLGKPVSANVLPTAIPGVLPTAIPGAIPTVTVPSTMVVPGIGALPAGAACTTMYGPIANVCNEASQLTQIIPATSVAPVPNAVVPTYQIGAPITSAAPAPVAAPLGKPVAAPMAKPIAAPMGKPVGAPMGKPAGGGIPLPTMTMSPLGFGVGIDGALPTGLGMPMAW